MSDRIEIVRKSFEAYKRGDFDALAEVMHPNLEMRVQYVTHREAAPEAAALTEEQIRQEAK